MKRTAFAIVAAAAVAAGAGFLAGRARAEDGGAPPSCPAVTHPLLTSLVGTWTTTSQMNMGGQKAPGTGSVSFRTAVGDTVLVQDYANDVGAMKFRGLALMKPGEDGKSLQAWWIDNFSKAPTAMSGALTDTGFEISGTNEQGEKVVVKLAKRDDGSFEHRVGSDEGEFLVETWKKAAK